MKYGSMLSAPQGGGGGGTGDAEGSKCSAVGGGSPAICAGKSCEKATFVRDTEHKTKVGGN